jgi:hypothetical protein
VDETESGGTTMNNEHLIEKVSNERYLGDNLSKNGKNNKNIKERILKEMSSTNQIMSILEDILFFGSGSPSSEFFSLINSIVFIFRLDTMSPRINLKIYKWLMKHY